MRMVGVGGLLVAAWLAGVSNILGYDSRYDNAASSPRRPPGPLRDVAWGEGTSDEMCVVYLRVTLGNDRLHRRRAEARDSVPRLTGGFGSSR